MPHLGLLILQNETLAKFSQSLTDEDTSHQQRLAILGTGSGKSIVMAGIAQAVGKTVMIVPDKTLVDQQAKEVGDMHSAAYVHGKKVEGPKVFTLDTLKDTTDVDIDWSAITKKGVIDRSALKEEDLGAFRDKFTEVLEGEEYDQIVLQAEHPLFQIIAPRIKDAMVLIDESHRHTFKKEDAELLATLKKENSIFSLNGNTHLQTV